MNGPYEKQYLSHSPESCRWWRWARWPPQPWPRPLRSYRPEQQRQILKDPGFSSYWVLQMVTVTVVEYFDYNCPYCRKLAPDIHTIVDKEHTVAVVSKEWPIFGGISVYAARSALASQWQGKYLAAHDALIGAPRLSQETDVDDTLQKAGINILELKRHCSTHGAQIDAILTRNSFPRHVR